ncbi:MAG: hypothetical protein IJY04_01575, partial [Clostridia bacterium]|nr:hypothetical protein [Clostridia bacterium]
LKTLDYFVFNISEAVVSKASILEGGGPRSGGRSLSFPTSNSSTNQNSQISCFNPIVRIRIKTNPKGKNKNE